MAYALLASDLALSGNSGKRPPARTVLDLLAEVIEADGLALVSFRGDRVRIVAGVGTITTEGLRARVDRARGTGLATLEATPSAHTLCLPLADLETPRIQAVLWACRGAHSGLQGFRAVEAELALHVSRKLLFRKPGRTSGPANPQGWYRSQVPPIDREPPASEAETRLVGTRREIAPAPKKRGKVPITLQRLFPDWIDLDCEVERIVS
jgi:hypothetical protein